MPRRPMDCFPFWFTFSLSFTASVGLNSRPLSLTITLTVTVAIFIISATTGVAKNVTSNYLQTEVAYYHKIQNCLPLLPVTIPVVSFSATRPLSWVIVVTFPASVPIVSLSTTRPFPSTSPMPITFT